MFYDGPPFANVHRVWAPAHRLRQGIKRAISHYARLQGGRRFGWDTHGRLAPNSSRARQHIAVIQIEAMGIAAFNDACRASVLRPPTKWQA